MIQSLYNLGTLRFLGDEETAEEFKKSLYTEVDEKNRIKEGDFLLFVVFDVDKNLDVRYRGVYRGRVVSSEGEREYDNVFNEIKIPAEDFKYYPYKRIHNDFEGLTFPCTKEREVQRHINNMKRCLQFKKGESLSILKKKLSDNFPDKEIINDVRTEVAKLCRDKEEEQGIWLTLAFYEVENIKESINSQAKGLFDISRFRLFTEVETGSTNNKAEAGVGVGVDVKAEDMGLFAREVCKFIKYLTLSPKKDMEKAVVVRKCCFCGKEEEVAGIRGVNNFKVYTLDKYGFAPEFNIREGYKRFPVCYECLVLLEKTWNEIEKQRRESKSKFSFFGMDCYPFLSPAGDLSLFKKVFNDEEFNLNYLLYGREKKKKVLYEYLTGEWWRRWEDRNKESNEEYEEYKEDSKEKYRKSSMESFLNFLLKGYFSFWDAKEEKEVLKGDIRGSKITDLFLVNFCFCTSNNSRKVVYKYISDVYPSVLAFLVETRRMVDQFSSDEFSGWLFSEKASSEENPRYEYTYVYGIYPYLFGSHFYKPEGKSQKKNNNKNNVVVMQYLNFLGSFLKRKRMDFSELKSLFGKRIFYLIEQIRTGGEEAGRNIEQYSKIVYLVKSFISLYIFIMIALDKELFPGIDEVKKFLEQLKTPLPKGKNNEIGGEVMEKLMQGLPEEVKEIVLQVLSDKNLEGSDLLSSLPQSVIVSQFVDMLLEKKLGLIEPRYALNKERISEKEKRKRELLKAIFLVGVICENALRAQRRGRKPGGGEAPPFLREILYLKDRTRLKNFLTNLLNKSIELLTAYKAYYKSTELIIKMAGEKIASLAVEDNWKRIISVDDAILAFFSGFGNSEAVCYYVSVVLELLEKKRRRKGQSGNEEKEGGKE